jgi:hypothetical protein
VTEGSQLLPPDAIGQADGEGIALQINFVAPTKKPEPIDVTPSPPAPSPYEGQPADLSRPAIEPPRPRQRTDFGIVEQPRSVFDRGDPKGWMR